MACNNLDMLGGSRFVGNIHIHTSIYAINVQLISLDIIHPAGSVSFVPQACTNIETTLPQEVVGQELALRHLTDIICQHISQKHPKKPLVLSVHGPPGVGKTYTHLWLARSLYNKQPAADLICPGMHCKGYKVRWMWYGIRCYWWATLNSVVWCFKHTAQTGVLWRCHCSVPVLSRRVAVR